MIEITTTVESIPQAKALLDIGIDTLYFGEEKFGLRLPASFSRAEQKELIELAHKAGKKVTIAVNGIMHPEKMREIPEYLAFLVENQVDQIAVGDPGVIHVIRKNKLNLPYIYDGETLVTSSRQINFWGDRGAVGAVVAREVPYLELKEMATSLKVYGEILVYGATCIHQSKRPLVQNFFSYIQAEDDVSKDRGLFLSEPKKEETHYSVYEDLHGTHIFADNDVNLITELDKLVDLGYEHWKLDGIYLSGPDFVEMAKVFVQAKAAFGTNQWTPDLATALLTRVHQFHPSERGLDTGFFLIDPETIK